MSEEITKAGGPAFPVSIPGCGDNGWQGMTLRDYFASQYMPAAMERGKAMTANEYERISGGQGGWSAERIGAVLAYRYADAMLLSRQRS